MQKRFIKIFLLFTVLGIYNAPLFAQTKFTASADPATIGKDETTTLSFTVENGKQVEAINPPMIKDFTIISGPDRESSALDINGVATSQSVTISFIIQPKAIGSFTIPGATAKVDGKTITSNSVTIKVDKHSTGNSPNAGNNNFTMSPFMASPLTADPVQQTNFNDNIIKKGENVQEKINKNLFLKAEPSKTSCYIGEPVVVIYKAYSRLPAEQSLIKTPAFDGFSMVDMTQPSNEQIEKLDGREYDVATILKAQLYPLQAGKLSTGTIEMNNTVHLIKGEYLQKESNDIFPGMLPPEAMLDQQVTLNNKPAFITVKPLPEKNKPASFRGAVGNFTIDAALDKDSFSTDDAGKLSILINGAGNMTLINTPAITWPQLIESFEPKITDNLNKLQVPITGSKRFDYNFTAERTGSYTIPPIVFSFFDPGTAAYKTVSTKPLSFIVTQGVKNIALVQGASPANDKGFFDKLSNGPQLAAELAALLIVLGLFFWFNRKKAADPIIEAQIPAQAIAHEEAEQSVSYLSLSEEKLLLHDSKAFYQALNKEVRQFLSAYFHILPEEINKKRIAEELDKKGAGISTSIKIQQLMDDIEWQLYSPVHIGAQLEQSFSNAKEMIYSLEMIAR